MALDLMGVYQSFRGGQEAARENRLLDMAEQARQAQGAALQGNKQALADLGGLDPQAYAQTKGTLDDQKRQFVQDFARQAYAARTPEQWNALVNRYEADGHVFDDWERDPANREAVIAKGIDLGDQLGLDLRREQSAAESSRWQQQFAADQNWRTTQADLERQKIAADERLTARKADPYSERAAAADQYGLKQGTPEYQTFVLTGNTPQEQRSTAADRAAIREADDMAFASQNAIGQLRQAIELNEKAGSGMFAGAQAVAARNDPTGLIFDQEQGKATTEFTNLVLNQALGSLKAIFGGNPTEGERAILLDLQASVDKSPAERRSILERAISMAERKMQYNQDRARELRGGTYYQPKEEAPTGGNETPAGAKPPAPSDTAQTDPLGIR
jgi:hypothetical protein